MSKDASLCSQTAHILEGSCIADPNCNWIGPSSTITKG